MDRVQLIDWESPQTEVLLNPRLPEEQQKTMIRLLQEKSDLQAHIWLTTSGTSNEPKGVALSKTAFLVSASAVNQHLRSTERDVWLNPLPDFHVGGLGIWARGFLSRARVIPLKEKWNPFHFHQELQQYQVTLASLVPAQVYDLIKNELQAPKALRGIVVGGGALSKPIYEKAIEFGWPVLPSYGLTEACSQVATASIDHIGDPRLEILSHCEVSVDSEKCFRIRSSALFTAYALFQEETVRIVDPKKEGWFLTEDLGALAGDYLEVYGRSQDFIKVGGESVYLSRLEAVLDEVKLSSESEYVLFPIEDSRLGHVIHLATTERDQQVVKELLDRFHERVLPFEKVRHIHVVDEIPRTPLQKYNRAAIRKTLRKEYLGQY